jgi:DNA-binding NarL/FixJ family response regulator
LSIRVFLIDDHTVVRQAVRVMLEAEPDISVVGEAGDAREGAAGVASARPDVAIVDLKMPGASGIGVIPALLLASPRTAVVVFTMYNNPVYVYEATHAGASGYVLKSASKDDLIRAVRAVHGGAGFLQDEVTKPLLRGSLEAAGADRLCLSLREVQVPERLCLATRTRRSARARHLRRDCEDLPEALVRELGVLTAQAVAIALRQQLIDDAVPVGGREIPRSLTVARARAYGGGMALAAKGFGGGYAPVVGGSMRNCRRGACGTSRVTLVERDRHPG